jgi:hypothetical protein
MTMRSAHRRWPVAAGLAASLVLLGACGLHISSDVEAKDQWKRSYTLLTGGTVEIRNTNGTIEIQPDDSNKVDVVADRTVSAATDEAAKDGLARFEIQETVSPDHIAIDSSSRGAGIFFNMSRRVDYHVHVPRWANIKLHATNGNITVTALTGTVHIETTNGRIDASALENSTTVQTTNGRITLDFAKLGEDGISCTTTNGVIEVTVPRDTKARLSARLVNGAIHTDGLEVAISEQSRRRLDGSIGGGGPTIRLETTNGTIALKGK